MRWRISILPKLAYSQLLNLTGKTLRFYGTNRCRLESMGAGRLAQAVIWSQSDDVSLTHE
jgi:hypothetical protein